MKPAVVIVFALVAAVLAAGCTGTQSPPATTTAVPTTGITAVPTTEVPATTPSGSTVPGPTETIPPNQAVSITAEKAGTYSTTIITSFDGGKGNNFVSRIDVKVTRPDGSVVTGSLQPIVGNTLELEGTNGTDRVEVTVFMKDGKVYKVIDQEMPYKTRG
ncbi:MAG TPA: hypothetical protein P5217_05845 [Methanoregulaceae archaeon]|nr:hypothetical protein [Methanoregulaceae archaeon]HPD74935.1 hypothetical protein [Methanoregulaceae archaeon]HRY75784.1 hypothetical protein [Methanoregulaceae archaeon]